MNIGQYVSLASTSVPAYREWNFFSLWLCYMNNREHEVPDSTNRIECVCDKQSSSTVQWSIDCISILAFL